MPNPEIKTKEDWVRSRPDKCVRCGEKLGKEVIVTETNIGPLCKDCFEVYKTDRREFFRVLEKEFERTITPSPEVFVRRFTE